MVRNESERCAQMKIRNLVGEEAAERNRQQRLKRENGI